jgi:hypothetical protein
MPLTGYLRDPSQGATGAPHGVTGVVVDVVVVVAAAAAVVLVVIALLSCCRYMHGDVPCAQAGMKWPVPAVHCDQLSSCGESTTVTKQLVGVAL